MLLLLVCSLLGTGYVAFRYTLKQEEVYNQQRLERKEQAVQRSMQWVLEQWPGTLNDSIIPVLFSDKICELSDVHGLDIALYSPAGELLISSVPGKPSDTTARMEVPAVVLSSLAAGSSREEGEDLDFGKYVQAYWNHFDAEGGVATVVNVRYEKRPVDGGGFGMFFRQLAPVYGVLFLATSALGLLLTRAIVGPLRALRAGMQALSLQGPMVPLVYPHQDAIGQLVMEYNRLQRELQARVEQLAKQEREGAWREMAIQVAHEVKNPLTPMLLGVQQLERAHRDGHPDFDQRLQRFAEMARTQIQALSQIAEDFRNVSQWGALDLQHTELLDSLRRSTDLFLLSGTSVTWNFQLPEEPLHVWASPPHLTRVFNNLLNNALEAISEASDGRMGVVDIEVVVLETTCEVHIGDNGVGIAPERLGRIFDPHFTTKAHGTGLGLAMVRAITTQMGGTIDVRSERGRGSVFTLTLRRAPGMNGLA